jgi:hypothetical protein
LSEARLCKYGKCQQEGILFAICVFFVVGTMSGFWTGALCWQLINYGGIAWEGRRNLGVLSEAFARDMAEEPLVVVRIRGARRHFNVL